MTFIKRSFALSLVLAMLFTAVFATGVFTASAVQGAGLQQTTFRSYGADISFWNVSVSSGNDYSRVDFAKMKADGCQYVILRIGYEGRATRENTIDTAFLEYYKRGRAAGMPMGVYFYQLCDTYEEAVEDAQWVIDVIEENDMYFEYPIYYDVEDNTYGDKPVSLGNAGMEQLCLGWCETLEAAGYFPGIYGGGWSVLDKLSDDFKSKYDLWYAAYPSAQNPHLTTDKSDYCGMWQYAASGYNYDGVPANASLDVNVCYKDYPAIMKQYGYNNCGDPELEAARTELKDLMGKVEAATYKTYTDSAITALRTAYNEAAAVIANTSSTKDVVNAALAKLQTAYNNKGTNPAKGIYINTVNTRVNNGQGVVFTPSFGEINVTSANHSWTANVVAKWDINENAYVVQTVTSGGGADDTATPPVTLASDEIFIAVHSWEEGLTAEDGPVAGSSQNYRDAMALANGKYKLALNGINLQNGKVEVCSYISFVDMSADIPSDNITYGKSYTSSGIYAENGVQLYPDTNGTELTDGGLPVADATFDNPAFVGFNAGSDEYQANGYASVTVDLGGTYKINRFNANVASKYNEDSGIIAPKEVSVYVSYDNVNWYSAGSVVPVDNASVSTLNAEITPEEAVYARYVQYRFVGGGNWIMVSEVEAFGAVESNPPSNPVPDDGVFGDINKDGVVGAMDYVMLKRVYFGTYTTESDSDINKDGSVGAMDYVMLKRVYFGTYTVS